MTRPPVLLAGDQQRVRGLKNPLLQSQRVSQKDLLPYTMVLLKNKVVEKKVTEKV